MVIGYRISGIGYRVSDIGYGEVMLKRMRELLRGRQNGA